LVVKGPSIINAGGEHIAASFSRLDSKDELLGEIGFYDARNFGPSKFTENVESFWRQGIGMPFGFKVQRLMRSGGGSPPSNGEFAAARPWYRQAEGRRSRPRRSRKRCIHYSSDPGFNIINRRITSVSAWQRRPLALGVRAGSK
jgi:hypothetical protein